MINYFLHINCNSFYLFGHHSMNLVLALCDDPADIDNGTVTFNGTIIGDVATYTCDPDFELIGDANTTCTLADIDSAEYQPVPPSCSRECMEQYI